MASTRDDCRVLLIGDLILGEPDPDFFFDLARDELHRADLVIGHVEVPHTRRGRELGFDVPADANDPEHLSALGRAGFHVATLAGNHMFDFGEEGVLDTIDALGAAGVVSCGAGRDLAHASMPATLERRGLRIGVLSYNCVGPSEAWATLDKAGCAYVALLDAHDAPANTPNSSGAPGTRPEPASQRAMQHAIAQLRPHVDTLIVALHKGIVHTPAVLASYERPLCHAAIDAGADMVVGHHAHILRGIELWNGRPIFHGLGNFVTVTRALNIDNAHPARRAWALERRKRFGFTPDPDYPNYPFHPEAKHAMLADCRIAADGGVRAGFLPCWIHPSGQPELVGSSARGREVLEYVRAISAAAGLSTAFAWEGERVVVA